MNNDFICNSCGETSLFSDHCLYCEAEDNFLSQCPSWARKLGVMDLKLWNVIKKAMPLSKTARFDYLDSLHWNEDLPEGLTGGDVFLARAVLERWDAMAARPK